MVTRGQVLLRDLEQMLKKCAPGYVLKAAPHKIRVLWNGKTFPNLPKGEHGKRPGRAEIQVGHVSDLVKFFGILDCAKKHLGVLA